MKTAFFELLKAVGEPNIISAYLAKSSFDELFEFDLKTRRFRNVGYVTKKYLFTSAEGTFDELFGGVSDILVHPDDRETLSALADSMRLLSLLEQSEVPGLLCGEFRLRLITGSWRWVEYTLIAGERFGLPENLFRVYLFDIQNRKIRDSAENGEFSFFSYGDDSNNEITGLPNKKIFLKAVTKLIKNVSVKWCLISIDIENFKLFNDWYGHDKGDLLMTQIGFKLRKNSEKYGGTAGYFGQDDFCVLMPYNAELIENLYAEIEALISLHGNPMSFMPAFGVCVVHSESKLRDMLDCAFLAARYAKESFHSRIRVYDKSMNTKTDKEYHILSDFMQGMKNGEIVFYLQPQCRASSGRIVGAEALTRWIKPDGTVVPPGEFIPVLEKHGLITDLDLFIWEEVCKRQRDFINRGINPLPISVNVSAIDILNTDLASTFEGLIKKYDLSQEMLKIEITESAYISNTSLVKSTVQALREKGFVVLMDDFGAGYSSLNMLKNLNVDIVKLDAQFLKMDEENEEKSIHILESVTAMTKTIGVPVIVEGVETEEQKKFLKDMGCRYIQGYYFYRPMPTDDYESLITDRDKVDTSGITFKANKQIRLREILESNVYSDNMLNNILGPCAFYSLEGDSVDIVRFNEQFYEAAGDPEFQDRLTNITRIMPDTDTKLILKMLGDAERDRLNGSNGVLHYYKLDGTLASFISRFFYLRTEGNKKVFFGAVQDITKLDTLEKQMMLLSRYSPDTVIFLRRKPNSSIECTVLFNGLERELGLTGGELEMILNNRSDNKGFTEEMREINSWISEKIRSNESFETDVPMKTTDGKTITVTAFADYVVDETGTLDYIVTLRANREALQ